METFVFSYQKYPLKMSDGHWSKGGRDEIRLECFGRDKTLEELATLLTEAMSSFTDDVVDWPFNSFQGTYCVSPNGDSVLHLITRCDDATGPRVTFRNGMFWTMQQDWISDNED